MKESEENKCYYSTAIDEITITCSKKPKFDSYGFAMEKCKLYPCEKIRQINKENEKRNKKLKEKK